jgi:hypothetical protein
LFEAKSGSTAMPRTPRSELVQICAPRSIAAADSRLPFLKTRTLPGWVVMSSRLSGVKAREVGLATLATCESVKSEGRVIGSRISPTVGWSAAQPASEAANGSAARRAARARRRRDVGAKIGENAISPVARRCMRGSLVGGHAPVKGQFGAQTSRRGCRTLPSCDRRNIGDSYQSTV